MASRDRTRGPRGRARTSRSAWSRSTASRRSSRAAGASRSPRWSWWATRSRRSAWATARRTRSRSPSRRVSSAPARASSRCRCTAHDHAREHRRALGVACAPEAGLARYRRDRRRRRARRARAGRHPRRALEVARQPEPDQPGEGHRGGPAGSASWPDEVAELRVPPSARSSVWTVLRRLRTPKSARSARDQARDHSGQVLEQGEPEAARPLKTLGLGKIGRSTSATTIRPCAAHPLRAAPGEGRWLTISSDSLAEPAPGSRKERKRIGRGEGSGYGKTSGRGHRARAPARARGG